MWASRWTGTASSGVMYASSNARNRTLSTCSISSEELHFPRYPDCRSYAPDLLSANCFFLCKTSVATCTFTSRISSCHSTLFKVPAQHGLRRNRMVHNQRSILLLQAQVKPLFRAPYHNTPLTTFSGPPENATSVAMSTTYLVSVSAPPAPWPTPAMPPCARIQKPALYTSASRPSSALTCPINGGKRFD